MLVYILIYEENSNHVFHLISRKTIMYDGMIPKNWLKFDLTYFELQPILLFSVTNSASFFFLLWTAHPAYQHTNILNHIIFKKSALISVVLNLYQKMALFSNRATFKGAAESWAETEDSSPQKSIFPKNFCLI